CQWQITVVNDAATQCQRRLCLPHDATGKRGSFDTARRTFDRMGEMRLGSLGTSSSCTRGRRRSHDAVVSGSCMNQDVSLAFESFDEMTKRGREFHPRRRKKAEMAKGILEVQLIDAKGLKNTDLIDSGGAGQGSNPSWNETFKFLVNSAAADNHQQHKITMRVMDHDTFTADDFLGESTIHVGDLITRGMENGTGELPPTKYSVVLSDRSYCGEIRVGVTFTAKVRQHYAISDANFHSTFFYNSARVLTTGVFCWIAQMEEEEDTEEFGGWSHSFHA
ncbi:hypothetical protein BHE74_00045196, partial [Ensete ventricosum]